MKYSSQSRRLKQPLTLVVFFGLFLFLATQLFRTQYQNTNESDKIFIEPERPLRLLDFDKLHNENTTLILTPLKNAARHLDAYFENLNRLDFPKQKLSLGFLVGDSNDGTYEKLMAHVEPIKHMYQRITVLRKDFPEDPSAPRSGIERHAFEAQGPRRKLMAKSRNFLLSALEDEQWIVWWDVDVIQFPTNIIQQLIRHDKDVLATNCYCKMPNGSEMAYDNNAWHETPQSREWMATRDPNELFVEGYYDKIWTRRMPLASYRDYPNFPIVELDGVGATFLMVKADVHRAGVNFPAFVLDHQVETEGLAKMAKKVGFKVWGLPQLIVYHPC
ncbi:Anp1-domain-containing protein [Syncephalis fuscata]|nr:Anp1-domain-containing protein [Syncephalis fuscata]